MISIVIPLYNEEEAVGLLYERLTACAQTWHEDYEIILVNDGSTDATLIKTLSIAQKDHHIKVISFTRNFGHQAAVTAGIRYASGDMLAVMDADLQDPPEELGRFFEKCREGYDIVYAVRTKRKEHIVKRLCYWLFYRALSVLADIEIPIDAGDFCVMSRKVYHTLNTLPELNRFIRGLRSWTGYRQIGIQYERNERLLGKTKYSPMKLLNLALDGFINFSNKPLRIIMFLGIAIGCFAFLLGLLFLFQFLTDTTIGGYNPRQARGWTSLILSILFLGGMQLIGIGILGEYIGRLFQEIKRRPLYIIDQLINFSHDKILYPGDGK